MAQFAGAHAAHITSPRTAAVGKPFSKIEPSNMPLTGEGTSRSLKLKCVTSEHWKR